MFGKFADWAQQMKMISSLAGDENFKESLSNPKVRKLLQDPKFQEAIAEKNVFKLMAYAEFMELLKDPEIQRMIQNLKIP